MYSVKTKQRGAKRAWSKFSPNKFPTKGCKGSVPKQMNRNKMKKWEDNTTCPFCIINKGQTNFDDLKFILVSDA